MLFVSIALFFWLRTIFLLTRRLLSKDFSGDSILVSLIILSGVGLVYVLCTFLYYYISLMTGRLTPADSATVLRPLNPLIMGEYALLAHLMWFLSQRLKYYKGLNRQLKLKIDELERKQLEAG